MRRAIATGCLALLLAGCTSAKPGSSPSSTSSSTSTTEPAPSTTGSSTSTTSTTLPAVNNLTATSQLKAQLLAAYAAAKSLPVQDFRGPESGTTFYAYDTATGTYWATAQFTPASGAPQQVLVGMQDGGDRGVFSRTGGDPWHASLGGMPWPCPGDLPAGVMAAWNLTYPGSCIVASAQSPARSSANGGELLSVPNGTYFGNLLYFDLQFDGSGTLVFEPETWQGSSPPVSHTRRTVTLTFDGSTTTEYWVGSDPASSRAVSGRFDGTFAGVVKKAMAPFSTQPYSGYEITVSNPAGCQGACSQATSIVQVGSLTPTRPNPDFTEPAG